MIFLKIYNHLEIFRYNFEKGKKEKGISSSKKLKIVKANSI